MSSSASTSDWKSHNLRSRSRSRTRSRSPLPTYTSSSTDTPRRRSRSRSRSRSPRSRKTYKYETRLAKETSTSEQHLRMLFEERTMGHDEIVALCSTNKQFRKSCKDIGNTFWRQKIKQHCPHVFLKDELKRKLNEHGSPTEFVYKHDETKLASNDYYFLKYLTCPRRRRQTISASNKYNAFAILENGKIARFADQEIVPNMKALPQPAREHKYTDIFTHEDVNFVILDDGRLGVWGPGVPKEDYEGNGYYEKKAHSGRRFISVAPVGDRYGVALLDDGTIVDCGPVSWGYEYGYDILAPKYSDAKYVDVCSNNELYALGLLDNGTIVRWGRRIGAKGYSEPAEPVIFHAPLNRHFIAISSCDYYWLGLLDDGSIIEYAMGKNDVPHLPTAPNRHRYNAISVSNDYSLGLLDNGTIVSSSRSAFPPQPPKNRKFVAISAGTHYSLALLDNGKLFAWGTNQSAGIISQINSSASVFALP